MEASVEGDGVDADQSSTKLKFWSPLKLIEGLTNQDRRERATIRTHKTINLTATSNDRPDDQDMHALDNSNNSGRPPRAAPRARPPGRAHGVYCLHVRGTGRR